MGFDYRAWQKSPVIFFHVNQTDWKVLEQALASGEDLPRASFKCSDLQMRAVYVHCHDPKSYRRKVLALLPRRKPRWQEVADSRLGYGHFRKEHGDREKEAQSSRQVPRKATRRRQGSEPCQASSQALGFRKENSGIRESPHQKVRVHQSPSLSSYQRLSEGLFFL